MYQLNFSLHAVIISSSGAGTKSKYYWDENLGCGWDPIPVFHDDARLGICPILVQIHRLSMVWHGMGRGG